AGVVEFSANPIANSTTGTFIFLREDSPFHSAFITGVQVPVEGDYSIDFYTEGGIRGGGGPIFAIAVGGTFVPSGDNLTFGTVTGSTTVSGGSFSSADTRNVPTIGTAIVHLTPSDVIRVINGDALSYDLIGLSAHGLTSNS